MASVKRFYNQAAGPDRRVGLYAEVAAKAPHLPTRPGRRFVAGTAIPSQRANWWDASICLGLLLLIALAFLPVARNGFINYDDSDYVTENEYVSGGLTLHGLYTAFTTPRAANWHPLTWFSHMVDCQLFELRPAGHHLMSLAIHAANSILLYFILRRMTAAAWPSAAVAALFAVHPLHVESVAWVAERKDVLSTLFGLAAIRAWLGYVARPGVARYLAVLLLYACSLMSKSMLVTLPCLLLLLDWWPLGRVLGAGEKGGTGEKDKGNCKLKNEKYRFQIEDGANLQFSIYNSQFSIPALLLEKLPLALMAVASCVVTVYTQSGGHAIVTLAAFPLVTRLATIALSYFGYLQKLFVPVNLAPIYPWSKAPNYAAAAACAAALAVATILLLWGGLFARGSGRRYLAVGWLWYLGLLVPVIGVVQVGQQAMADRYTYLPAVGVFILLAWSAADVLVRWRLLRLPVSLLAAAVLAACCVLSNAQVRLWTSTKTLFAHTVAVTRDNPVALTNLGLAAINEERFDDAQRYLGEALRLDGSEMDAWGNLASLYRKQKKYGDALRAYAKIDQLCPGNAKCYSKTADTLKEMGNVKDAETYYSRAVAVEPASVFHRYSLAMTQQSQGEYRDALMNYGEILRLDQGNPAAPTTLPGSARHVPMRASATAPAGSSCCSRPARRKPDCDANLLDTLAAAYAEAGQFDRAADTATKAIAKAQEQSLPAGAVADMEKRLALYQKRQPYREP